MYLQDDGRVQGSVHPRTPGPASEGRGSCVVKGKAVPDDSELTTGLTEILSVARSGVPLDDVMALFLSRTVEFLGADAAHVRPFAPVGHCGWRLHLEPALSAEGDARSARFDVPFGLHTWGELRVTRMGRPFENGDADRGRLLAEVLGTLMKTLDAGVPSLYSSSNQPPGAPHGAVELPGAAEPRPDDLVSMVISCAAELDRMPEASTSARLALVADLLADVVGASTWCVSLAHDDRLFTVSTPWTPGETGDEHGSAQTCGVPLAECPERQWAVDGGAYYYADQLAGDRASRRALPLGGHVAVIGAGGYDQDGRSWLVEVFADFTTRRLELVTPVLAAVVQSALCFPRDAIVPRPVDPAVWAILHRPRWLAEGGANSGLDSAGVGRVS